MESSATNQNGPASTRKALPRARLFWMAGALLFSMAVGLVLWRYYYQPPVLLSTPPAAAETEPGQGQDSRGFTYVHEQIIEIPWSIHVLKLDRSRSDYEFHTTLAKGGSFGLTTLTEQIKTLPAALGEPVAAINGDFWKETRHYEGDPMGLHLREGELLSAPSSRACLWFDTNGQPHATNVLAHFNITWPNDLVTPFGLNEERTNRGAVLYTSALGASTRTKGGRELLLERVGTNDWLPLRIGQTLQARVKAKFDAGDAPIAPGLLVLSLSPDLLDTLPDALVGTVLRLSTATTPSLAGARTGLGGGPMLVQNGKPMTFTGAQPRHPRTAIGWNDKHFFMVEVDGRQGEISVGMSLPELADYLAKLGCQEAMNLDGGGSSTFWMYGQVMNSPCYGSERAMANALVLLHKNRSVD